MVLDFGLTKKSTVSHSISSTKLSSLKHKRRADKKRQASSKDYCASSSDSEDESSYYSDYSYDNLYDEAELDEYRQSHHKKMAHLNSSQSLENVLDFEQVEQEIIADYTLKLAADLEAEWYQQSHQAPPPAQQQQQQQTILPPAPAESDDDVEDEDDVEESDDFLDSLDEVHTRFLLNVPPEELSTSERIFFQLEQAWWYYEDLICDKLEQDLGYCPLPRFANMKPFSKRLFDFSPLLRDLDFHKLWREFAAYKRKISTYGCILLNEACTHVVLCQMYKSNTWTFPAGKINQNEKGIDAAARETYEETGFDPHCTKEGGLTHQWFKTGQTDKITWKFPLEDPNDALTFVEQPSGKRRTCYVCKGVPEDFPFDPVCRKEVDNIEWIDLRNIKEYKSFAVTPFIGQLKKWIKRQNNPKAKKKKERKSKSRPKSRSKSSQKGERDKSSSRQRGSVNKKDKRTLVDSGLMTSMGDATRWTEQEMFEANSKLQGGRTVEYDGNPHAFAEDGFGVDDEATGRKRVDPHAFRVVGGSFMNSEYGDKLATAAGPSNYQPLVRDAPADGELQPFFSEQGATPWGDVVEEVKSEDGIDENPRDDGADPSQEQLSMLRKDLVISNKKEKSKKSKSKKESSSRKQEIQPPVSGDYDYNNPDNDNELMIFATDKEITARRQREYELEKQQQQKRQQKDVSQSEKHALRTERLRAQYNEDMKFVHNWVKNLPNPVDFQIENVDAIIDQHFGKTPGSGSKVVKTKKSKRHSSTQREKENRM